MANNSDFDSIFNTLPREEPPKREDEGSARPGRVKTSRPPRGGGRRAVSIVTIIVLLLGSGGVWWVWNEYGQRLVNYFAAEEVANFEGGGASPSIDIVVAPGDIGETVARKLAEEGVTASFEAVYDLLLQNATITFQPGTYRLLTGMSGENAISALQDPSNTVQISFVIPEGFTMEQALARISERPPCLWKIL